MKSESLALSLLGLTLLATGCTRGEAAQPPAQKPAATATAAGTLPRLVFFMNPNGTPCQMQDRVLEEMEAELEGKVDLVYYRTTEGRDLAQFQEFGIRSLPALVLTDAAGHELRRGTPGIQPVESVRRLVGP